LFSGDDGAVGACTLVGRRRIRVEQYVQRPGVERPLDA
jgi:hypothetical protein